MRMWPPLSKLSWGEDCLHVCVATKFDVGGGWGYTYNLCAVHHVHKCITIPEDRSYDRLY